MAKNTGWGFKINYVEAIKDDEARIKFALMCLDKALYSRPIRRQDPSLQAMYGDYVVDNIASLVCYFPDVAASLGLTPQDVADFAFYADVDAWAMVPSLPESKDYKNGKRVCQILETLVGHSDLANVRLFKDEADARANLRKARADLARHKRNQIKYGVPSLKPGQSL
jgi:hypothetical protein